ncbi:MAG: hypothetical protein WC236_06995 [Gallionellaceae bacterium]|jgi:hypothetical protein
MAWIELLNQISIFVAVWVAVYGIDSWRREHTGKRQIELAEDSLALFYEASDAIKHLRHPLSFTSEIESIERGKYENDKEFKARENASVVFKRYNVHQELFNKLHAMRYRFMAQFGKDKAIPFDDIRNIVNEITSSARILSRLWPRDNFKSENEQDLHRRQVEKYESIFWEGLEEDDPINPRLNLVISEIEATCQDVISGKGSLHGWLNKKLGRS